MTDRSRAARGPQQFRTNLERNFALRLTRPRDAGGMEVHDTMQTVGIIMTCVLGRYASWTFVDLTNGETGVITCQQQNAANNWD